jgi:hypothetical protein
MLSYLIRPYHVGSKNAKSLAIIIPSEVRRDANIDLSAIFLLKINKKTKVLTKYQTIGLKNIKMQYQQTKVSLTNGTHSHEIYF